MNETFKELFHDKMFIGIPVSQDVGDKIALISMICQLTWLLKQKKPGLDHYQVIRMCTKNKVYSDELITSLALVCDWFGEGCTKFPNLGVSPKEMPAKVCELLDNMLPF